MSKIHVTQGSAGLYTTILHAPMPSGNNSVGVPWKTCFLGSSVVPPISTLPVGTGSGQITALEASQIATGDVLEYQWGIQVNADGTTPSLQIINANADQEIARQNATLAARFKYFGYTQE